MMGRSAILALALFAYAVPVAAGDFAQRIAQALGDRTYVSFPLLLPDSIVALHYRHGRDVYDAIAYFEAPEEGAEGGRLVVWSSSEKALQYGTWTAEDFRLCVEPNAFYTRQIGWRLQERLCIGRDTDLLKKGLFFEGDVFGLAQRTAPPFELSAKHLPEVFRLLRQAFPAKAVP